MNRKPQATPRVIYRFAHDLVTDWGETGQLTLRPSEKETLKKLIASAIPLFLAENKSVALETYISLVKEQQLESCVKAVSEVDELFSGVINKQRAVQACSGARTVRNRQVPTGSIFERECM